MCGYEIISMEIEIELYRVKGLNFILKSVRMKLSKGGSDMNNLSEELKKVLLAGIGAIALTAEKSADMVDQLVKKGELTVEQGKILNEELKHTIADKLREPVNVDKLSQNLEKMSAEDLEILKGKIEELQNAKSE